MEKTLNMSCIDYLRSDKRAEQTSSEQSMAVRRSGTGSSANSVRSDRRRSERAEAVNPKTHKSADLSKVKKLLMKLILIGIFITILWGAIAVHAGNKNTSYSKDEYIYKMIVVEDNETLWSLGKKWGSSTADDIRTWIKNVEEMNCMNNDQIRYGQELLIYCGESMKDAHR